MTSVWRAFAAFILVVGIPHFGDAQALSQESRARAVRAASYQMQTAPISRRGPNRAPKLLPILVGAGIGGGLGVVVAHRSEAPVAIPISIAAVGATVGYIFSSR